MVKSPAHWQEPASDKASAAAEEKQLKVGQPSFKLPADGDVIAAAKQQGRGFSDCAVQVNRYSDNPAALRTRDVPVHKYEIPGTGADGGSARVEQQNRLAAKRK